MPRACGKWVPCKHRRLSPVQPGNPTVNQQQLLAAMDAILAKADAEGRGITTEEDAEFGRLKAQLDALGASEAATETRRSNLTALRQASRAAERIEQFALAPNQTLASLPGYSRPQGNTMRAGDFIRARVGIGGFDPQAA